MSHSTNFGKVTPNNINATDGPVLVDFFCLHYDHFQSILTIVFDIYVHHMCLPAPPCLVQPEKGRHVTSPRLPDHGDLEECCSSFKSK